MQATSWSLKDICETLPERNCYDTSTINFWKNNPLVCSTTKDICASLNSSGSEESVVESIKKDLEPQIVGLYSKDSPNGALNCEEVKSETCENAQCTARKLTCYAQQHGSKVEPPSSPLNFIWSYRDLKLCESDASKCYGGTGTTSDAPCITQTFQIEKIEDFNKLTDNKCRKDEVAVNCPEHTCMYDGPIHQYHSLATMDGEHKPLKYNYQCVNATSYFASKDTIPLCKED